MELRNWDLEDLIELGRDQTRDLTYYKMVFTAFERLTYENAESHEIYQSSLLALVSGFLASLKPEYLPQALAAKNFLLKRIKF